MLFTWLCQHFPKCFNLKDKRSLKIGISNYINRVCRSEYLVPIDQYILRNVIKRYVVYTRYQFAVIAHKKRSDVNDDLVNCFSGEYLDYSQKRLAKIQEKAQLRAQSVDVNTHYQHKYARGRFKNLSQPNTEAADTKQLHRIKYFAHY